MTSDYTIQVRSHSIADLFEPSRVSRSWLSTLSCPSLDLRISIHLRIQILPSQGSRSWHLRILESKCNWTMSSITNSYPFDKICNWVVIWLFARITNYTEARSSLFFTFDLLEIKRIHSEIHDLDISGSRSRHLRIQIRISGSWRVNVIAAKRHFENPALLP